jgi:hypothetical protein
VAYTCDESGQSEIYIRSFPDGSQTRQITFEGGDWGVWSPDGSKLYFRRHRQLWAVSISPADGSVIGRPSLVYEKRFGQSDFDLPDYTIAPDGRILLIEPSERGPTVDRIEVIANWQQILRVAQ